MGTSGPAVYESDRTLAEYLLFHYGAPEEQMPWPEGPRDATGFPVRCVRELIPPGWRPASDASRAIDVGCAVGRSAFELAAICREAVGIDFSSRFIGAAETIRRDGALPYFRAEEGERRSPATALRPEGIDPGRVRFETGDATALRDDLGDADIVLAANLLCRLPDPARFLARLPSLVRPGGLAIIATPCTWLEEFTPRERWLCAGGRTTFEGVADALSGSFDLAATRDLPFLIREHARKFQWSISQGSAWIRKS